MTTSLIIEIGNSNAKLAIFSQGKIATIFKIPTETILNQEIWSQLDTFDFQKTVVAGSGNISEWCAKNLSPRGIRPLLFTQKDIPIASAYQQPLQMGMDRMLGAYYSYSLSKKESLYIDCGTCLTFTLVDKSGTITGGAISPGLKMRLKAMHHFTFGLPLLAPNFENIRPIGHSTEENMKSGALYGYLAEIEWRIKDFQAIFPKIAIFNTGGDAEIVSNQIKFPIFADSNFILNAIYHLSISI